MRSSTTISAAVLVVVGACRVEAQPATTGALPERIDAALSSVGDEQTVRFAIGRSASGTPLWCLAQPEVLDLRSTRQRRLIVGGLDGSDESVQGALAAFDRLTKMPESHAVYACIPIANPDLWAEAGTADAGKPLPPPVFPPEGTAYNTPSAMEAHFVWRFIGWFAPDVVVEVHGDAAPEWQQVREGRLPADRAWPEHSLAAAVRRHPVAGIATPFSLRVPGSTATDPGKNLPVDSNLLQDYQQGGHPPIGLEQRSALRQAVQQRIDRQPVKVAQQLAQHYGDHLKTVMYQPALALVARLRLGELTGNANDRRDVERIVAPYVDGTKTTLPPQANGSLLAGHLIFAELARLTGDPRCTALVRRAADFGFDERGALLEAMPFHSEMSDAVFMSGPILTAAARYTGEERYLLMAARHLAFMQRLCLREDGLYRHSPLCEAAWGRGNGFPALGLALCLADLDAMPASPARDELRQTMHKALGQHLRALARHQDVTGMWRQVIDDAGSYREMTSTCMIAYAMVRGIRWGWLDEEEFAPVARRAWEAVKVRVGSDGVLLDVCTGTGKQKSLRDYRDRSAILGQDERGGAMALMVAVEMAAWDAGQAANPDAAPAVSPAADSPARKSP